MALLNDVLDLSKIEAGKMEISCADGDFVKAVRRMQRLFQPQAEEKGLEHRLALRAGFPALAALRSGAGAAMRVQPPLQRDQVHRARARESTLSAEEQDGTAIASASTWPIPASA